MAEKTTPLMRQYTQLKKKHADCILLFRLGDFYETFGDDAIETARVCGITLTKRNNGGAGDVPLAGFPHHQLDNYLPKLVRAGLRVAVCEQLEDPKLARGIVRRDVVEVVTPGVALNEKLLDAKSNTYLCALFFGSGKKDPAMAGCAFADVSTGEFFTSEVAADDVISLLESMQPAEIVVPRSAFDKLEEMRPKLSFRPALSRLEDWIFEVDFAAEVLTKHFGTASLKGFGVDTMTVGLAAAGAAFHYISETQRGSLAHIRSVRHHDPGAYMMLDAATRRNLEITWSMNDSSRQGTLLSILDDTKTPMGARLLKQWVTRPLRHKSHIEARLQPVDDLAGNAPILGSLRDSLAQITDLERLVSRVCTGRCTPRDLAALRRSLAVIPTVKEVLYGAGKDGLQSLATGIDTVDEAAALLDDALVEEPPVQLGNGEVFRSGYSAQLDEYRSVLQNAEQWIREYQEQERAATGISTLKVSSNNVFGWYIEISNTHKGKAPDRYDRKQTLANAERYITPELKDMEQRLIDANANIDSVERELFAALRNSLLLYTERIQDTASRLAHVDCLQSFAEISRRNNYIRPKIDDSERLNIVNGRHPVVEKLLPVGEAFIPNSTSLTTDSEQVHILTGPNMAGKSSYLRQVGLIVLLAQIGCFVPADGAEIGVVDRIFTRVGAQDNIVAGESTFLVEMQEAANILNNATGRSLVLLDEVGRGTATFDGLSIAWAMIEYIHNRLGAKTLFATHYHELNELARRLPRVVNYRVEVREVGASIVFTRKVVPGFTDHSFGIHVAEMAGLPAEVTKRAREVLAALEGEQAASGIDDAGAESDEIFTEGASPVGKVSGGHTAASVSALLGSTRADDIALGQLTLFEVRDDEIREKLRALDVNALTPLQAFQLLLDLRNTVIGSE